MLNTTEYNNNGLHVFVFCCADYKDIVEDCIKSIDQYVLDPIASYNIVSNATIEIDKYRLIKDRDFWSLLDPDFKYQNLYNHNWIKQQIFKLNLDHIVSGNVLIIDAEVRFQKPTLWITDNRSDVFYTDRWENPGFCDSTDFVKQILNIDIDSTKNFIVEATIFSTEVLKEIRDQIEKLHQVSHLTAYQQVVFVDPTSIHTLPKVFMSEYDMYINYLLKFHPDKLHNMIDLNSHPLFLSIKHTITSNSMNSQTSWLTFYEQIRDKSWPDCEHEKDFDQLPLYIQKEIIEVFGYTPTELGKFDD